VTCVAGAWRVCGVFECYGRVACAWRCAWPYAVWGLVRVVRVVCAWCVWCVWCVRCVCVVCDVWVVCGVCVA
jgi:hypothetical protein